MRATGLVITFVFIALSQSVSAQTRPICESASSDSDGDGWGWENNRSCIVSGTTVAETFGAGTSTDDAVCVDSDGDGFGWDGTATCFLTTSSTTPAAPTVSTQSGPPAASLECLDPDGDGFGWDGSATCLVPATSVVGNGANAGSPASSIMACIDSDGDGFGWNGIATCLVAPSSAPAAPVVTPQSGPVASRECVDSDGDGFGWNGVATCLVAPSSAPAAPIVTPQSGPSASRECVDPDGDGFGWDGFATCLVPATAPTTATGLLDGITDVVLMMGQSNALGEDTVVDRDGLDAVNENIIAWTQFDGWQVADLCTQIWQKGWFPWRGGVCSNHPAFQIAKGIVAADPSRKVAIIPTGIAGKPISWWDDGALAYALANEHTRDALAALPGNTQVDLVAWSQGEANDGVEDQWYDDLTDLISRLRSESWFNAQETVFIAQETKDSSVNDTLPRFDSDNDDRTSWIQASDLTTKDGVHWSGSALRTLGNRYAAEYLSID